MLAEIRELGFSRVELSHGVPVSLVPGILEAVREGVVKVSSLHNFCPLPSGTDRAAPNFYEPSAGNRVERTAWLRQSLRTLELARCVGANCVVMHGGSVHFRFRSPAPKLASRNDGDGMQRGKALQRLQKRSAPALSRVESQIRHLLSEAGEEAPCLALENREGILELPLDDQFPDLLGRFDPRHLAYWHDTGHAEIKRRMGLLDPLSRLEQLADRTAGFHVHDVHANGRDHQPLGSGTVDFAYLREFIRPCHHVVLELHPRVSGEEVIASRKRLLDLLS
ncbi:MAG: sugar phosphate isomerase/epimerase [Verrucomicrobiae bacterium]|nr:sugar phosphate isomerase/epimerase [Verrucomicrobiae bacterium]